MPLFKNNNAGIHTIYPCINFNSYCAIHLFHEVLYLFNVAFKSLLRTLLIGGILIIFGAYFKFNVIITQKGRVIKSSGNSHHGIQRRNFRNEPVVVLEPGYYIFKGFLKSGFYFKIIFHFTLCRASVLCPGKLVMNSIIAVFK